MKIQKINFVKFFFNFRKGKNAAQAPRKLWGVYGDKFLSHCQCQNWFAPFRSGNLDATDEPRLMLKKSMTFLKQRQTEKFHLATLLRI